MRRRQAKKHPLIPDPRFNDTDVTYFVNNLMLKGKKSTAFDIFYSAIDLVTERTGEEGLEQWKQAVFGDHAKRGGPQPPCRGSYFPDSTAHSRQPQAQHGGEVDHQLRASPQRKDHG